MKTMYKTSVSRYSLSAKIEAVEVVKETAKQVTTRIMLKDYSTGKERPHEDRCNKFSDWHQFHETWEDAHAYLLGEAEKRVESARMNLERTKGTFGNVKGMKKPG